MIRKLQYKFIAISAGTVLVVIALLLLMVNEMFYITTMRQSYKTLDYLAKHEGEFPDDDNYYDDSDFGERNETLRYQRQYFSAWIDDVANNNSYKDNTAAGDFGQIKIENINLNHISSISEEEAGQIIQAAISQNSMRGIIRQNKQSYCYLKKDLGQETLIIFLNCTADYYFISDLRIISFLFSLLCFAFFLIVVTALSRRAIRPVIRNMENQKQFITNAGHELKTPLAIISANMEVMEMMEGENEWTRSTMNQVERLNGLIQKLITLAKMGETTKEEIKEVNLSSLAEKTAEDFQTLADQKNLSLQAEIEPELTIKGVETHVAELINILCDNAVKYCDKNGQVSISLRKRPHAKGTVLEISNSCADKENIDLSRLFDRFYRGDSSHNNEKAGYGIGLAMAEGFVEESRGKIRAEHKDGTMIFTVLFP